MKTEFLKSLGITDQDTIDSIMAENGRDITKVRKELDSANAKVEGLQSQLSERDNQLSELQKTVDKNSNIAQKLEKLQSDNDQMKSDYEHKLAAMQRDNEIDGKLRDAKAKNIKAVKALLDMSDGADIDSQITNLKAAEDSAFLFEADSQRQPPTGATPAGSKGDPQQPARQNIGLAQAVANVLNKNK